MGFCFWAASQTWTGDLRVTNALLYQLSYSGNKLLFTGCKGTPLFEKAKRISVFFGNILEPVQIFLGITQMKRVNQMGYLPEKRYVSYCSGLAASIDTFLIELTCWEAEISIMKKHSSKAFLTSSLVVSHCRFWGIPGTEIAIGIKHVRKADTFNNRIYLCHVRYTLCLLNSNSGKGCHSAEAERRKMVEMSAIELTDMTWWFSLHFLLTLPN